MVLNRVFKNNIAKSIEQTGFIPITNLYVVWNDEKKVLGIIEKRNSGYEIHALKLFLSGDKMHKISASSSTNKDSSIGSILTTKTHNLGIASIDGITIRDPHTCINMLLTAQEEKIKQNKFVPLSYSSQETTGRTIGHICEFVENEIEVTNNPVHISDSILLHHTIITGSTGGGKTEVAKRIVSEVNKERITVVVLTPEPQLWKLLNQSYLVNEEIKDEKINVVDFSDFANIEEESSSFLEDLIDGYTNTESTDNLVLLLVVDEAHQFKQEILEKAVRILRKYGVGLILISHTYADFNRGIRANIQTHIAMYTNWEKDLSFIRQFQQKGGPDYTYLLRHIPEGYGIFRSRTIFRNQPILCKFLISGEVFQLPTQIEKFDSSNETQRRRKVILDLIHDNPGITAENIQNKLSKKMIDCSTATVYKDLEFLVNKTKVKIVKKEERGKKHYAIIDA